jgi:outer membrane lipoprotein-sorting protein
MKAKITTIAALPCLLIICTLLTLPVALSGCGEKSSEEMRAESIAKERADRNRADHEKRSQ